MKFARCVYGIAGVYGVLVIAPLYFLESQIGAQDPPAITHPEYFYGFIAITLAWQLAFLLIARQPDRFRPMMIPSILEKTIYGVAVVMLFAQERVSGTMLGFSCVDMLLG